MSGLRVSRELTLKRKETGMSQLLNPAQMTLEVGGDIGIGLTGTFKIGGDLQALKEIPKGADVRVVITDADGEVIATQLGHVAAITFKEHRDKGDVRWTERRHGVKLD